MATHKVLLVWLNVAPMVVRQVWRWNENHEFEQTKVMCAGLQIDGPNRCEIEELLSPKEKWVAPYERQPPQEVT